MGFFENVPLAPSDAIFGLVSAFNADKNPRKMSFVVGYYRSEEGQTPVIGAVREAEKLVVQKTLSKEYLPIDGDREYLAKIGHLVFGSQWHDGIVSAQTVGGTGALRLFADLSLQQLGNQIWLSDPTWPNHRGVFSKAGFTFSTYRYYDAEKRAVDFDAIVSTLEKLPPRSIVMLHANCHNPTGMDLNHEQWAVLSDLFKKKQLFPLFDMAYQGFGDDLDKDAEGVHLFAARGHEMAVAYSCAKNFSLYGERVGALFIVCKSGAENVRSQGAVLIRTNYSNPPRHGAAIVKEVLSTAHLERAWRLELQQMRVRMDEMRKTFTKALERKIPDRDWSFMRKARGLFCYTGLGKDDVEKLKREFGIYMPSDGRINVTALNASNLEYVVESIASL